jgi:translocation and assembly module TamB
MMKRRRVILTAFAGLAALALLCAGIALLVIQSQWFKNQVRLRIISTIEKTSGGKVELRAFDYDWHTLSVDMHDFSLHGTEPASAPPLFKASRFHVGLRISSVIKKDVDIRDLIVDKPEIYLLIQPDGTTNLPHPQVQAGGPTDIAQQLITLAVKHFELNRGTVELDNRKYDFNVRGDQLHARVGFESVESRYSGSFSSQEFFVRSGLAIPFAANISTRFVFGRDHAELNNLTVALKQTRMEGRIVIDHFTQPYVAFNLSGHIDASELAGIVKFPGIQAGTIALTGSGTYTDNDYLFHGTLDGNNLGYRRGAFAISGAALRSRLLFNKNGLSFDDMRAKVLGATVAGNLEFKDLHSLLFQGRYQGLSIGETARLLGNRPIAWDGYASGSLSITGDVKKQPVDFRISSIAAIAPGSHGIPLSGRAEVYYTTRNNSVRFGDSQFSLPSSTITLSGTPGQLLRVSLDSANLQDLEPAIALVRPNHTATVFPFRLDRGHAHFEGSIAGPLGDPSVEGQLALTRLLYQQVLIDNFQSRLAVNAHQLTVTSLTLSAGASHVSASGQVALTNWMTEQESSIQIHGNAQNASIDGLWTELLPSRKPWFRGTANATLELAGTIENPSGSARIMANDIDVRGEHINSITANAKLAGNRVIIDQTSVQAGDATLKIRGEYEHAPRSWASGRINLHVDSDRFEIANLATVRRMGPDVTGLARIHMQAAANLSPNGIALQSVAGNAYLSAVAVDHVPYGSISLNALTEGGGVRTTFKGNVRDCQFDGSSRVELSGDYRGDGSLKFSPLKFSTIKVLIPWLQGHKIPLEGLLQGGISFRGAFARPSALTGSIHISQVQINPQLDEVASQTTASPTLFLRNAEPVVIDYAGQTATIRSLRLAGTDTNLAATGKIGLTKASPFDLNVNGSINLQVLALFEPAVQAKGITRMNATITGPVSAPSVTGTLEVQESSVYLDGFTNGLDHANGLVRFDRNRATIQRFTAESGGGRVSVGGFIGFEGGSPLSYRLQVAADAVRFRYNGVSITSNADLKYTGTSEKSLLSGNVIVTKAAFNPNTDVGSLFAANSHPVATPSTESGFLHRIRLEVDVQSASTLELTTSLSQDVQAEIDLRLRGTPDRPIVLGRFSVNQGQIQFFGSKYTINRGEVAFVNPVKIEPVLDLDLQTQARGVTVNVTISGTLDKLNVSYRSDPPLQSSEIIALLATGRTPDATSGLASSQTVNQNSAIAAGANTILGSAMSPVSGRLQRFFGITHLKIDPMLQGIENVPQARVTLEQQISRQITITYVTNLSRTSQQIFRLEWALSREYSLVAIRDENGLFGVDLQYKKRFK